MAIIIKCDETGKVITVNPSGDPFSEEAKGAIILHDQNTESGELDLIFKLIQKVPVKYMKKDLTSKGAATVREMSAEEKVTVDSAEAMSISVAKSDAEARLEIPTFDLITALIKLLNAKFPEARITMEELIAMVRMK